MLTFIVYLHYCLFQTSMSENWGRQHLDKTKPTMPRTKHLLKQTQFSCCRTYPTVMSNMLLPTELDTAMSPRPLRATITLVIRSGMDVPAAKIVNPMISSLIPMVSPT